MTTNGSFTVTNYTTYKFPMPLNSGARFYTTNGAAFYAVGGNDTGASDHRQRLGLRLGIRAVARRRSDSRGHCRLGAGFGLHLRGTGQRQPRMGDSDQGDHDLRELLRQLQHRAFDRARRPSLRHQLLRW